MVDLMKLFLLLPARPKVEDCEAFTLPSKLAGMKHEAGKTILMFSHGEDFWTIPLYHN